MILDCNQLYTDLIYLQQLKSSVMNCSRNIKNREENDFWRKLRNLWWGASANYYAISNTRQSPLKLYLKAFTLSIINDNKAREKKHPWFQSSYFLKAQLFRQTFPEFSPFFDRIKPQTKKRASPAFIIIDSKKNEERKKKENFWICISLQKPFSGQTTRK